MRCRRTLCYPGLKLIGEPWDIGPGGYQVGGFPPGWGEWNDKYRDTVREYWKGDNVSTDFAARLLGSGDLYDLRGRRPWASVKLHHRPMMASR
ncbi:glycogen debranching protein GlgX [Enterobacter cancerogenus]|uniref:Glycogen debranching protein GlgX n=1 Tax=Enterobacter cancerogenus TaxID=69218 RepID=A0A484ZBT7_9ENTR|nr:glycogen debranching protein GlgX [Enterobacter cancerogenus]